LYLVGSSILLYLIDDARSNKNQVPNVIIQVKPMSPRFSVMLLPSWSIPKVQSQFFN